MSYASMRRHALMTVAAATIVVVPLGITTTAADAVSTAGATTASVAAPARATSATASHTALTKTVKHKKAVKKKPRTPKAIAKALVTGHKYKWGIKQYRCLRALWNRESGWRVHAGHPGGGAYGIPQALPGWKMGSGWRHSAKAQIRWGLKYIDGRYGSPCAADQHQRRANWY